MDPHGLFCGETPLGPCGSPTKSVRVRAGPVGSGRARVVEFSLKLAPYEVNARRARLVPGWVTVFGRVYHLGM